MVLHKNKWDKKASRKHEQKLGAKDSKALEEEKNKAAARRGQGSAQNNKPSTVTAAKAPVSEAFPALSQKTTGSENTPQNDQPEEPGSLADEEDEGSGAEGDKLVGRKRIVQPNAWRYEEPEPEPGEEVPEEDDHTEEHLTLAREKLKGIEERETKEEKLNTRIDITSDPNELKTYKGSVVVVARDEFKDVSEKIRKQKLAEDFKRRFGSPSSATARRDGARGGGSNDMAKHEDDLDDILGNLPSTADSDQYLEEKEFFMSGTSLAQRRDKSSAGSGI